MLKGPDSTDLLLEVGQEGGQVLDLGQIISAKEKGNLVSFLEEGRLVPPRH